jgi:hypothetical protein
MTSTVKRCWKVNCTENWFPGLWQLWFASQCVAVGWPPRDFSWNGPSGHMSWTRARNRLKEMRRGDEVVVQLRGNRVARVGTIVEVCAKDDEWMPFVPKSSDHSNGEMGRRVQVRWDLSIGPSDPYTVVQLPAAHQLTKGEALTTIAEIPASKFGRIKDAMADDSNWVSLLARFGHEVLLSDYIATLPHYLEDGLQPYPSAKVREKVFTAHSRRLRSDVLLMDRSEGPVVVECKRDAPSPDSLRQLGRYLELTKKETHKKPRGILVHGGAAKLTQDVRSELRRVNRRFLVEVLRYELKVEFAPCR